MPTRVYDKEDILDACLQVFSRYGYDYSSAAMLAQAAGVSKALLFHHFGSKKQLYLDVLARYMQEAKENIAPAPFEEYEALDFFSARQQFSVNKYLFNRRHPAGYKLMMDAFFRTPAEVQVEVDANTRLAGQLLQAVQLAGEHIELCLERAERFDD